MAPATPELARAIGQEPHFCHDCGRYCASSTPEQRAASAAGGRFYCAACYEFRESFLLSRCGPITIDAIDALDVRTMALQADTYRKVLEATLTDALLGRVLRNARRRKAEPADNLLPDTWLIAIVDRTNHATDTQADLIRAAIRAS
jgi:hypothetical protein